MKLAHSFFLQRSLRQIIIIVGLLFIIGFVTNFAVKAVSSWTNTGSMKISRTQHTATLLSSGKVLAVGSATFASATETYDPSTGIWSYTSGSLNVARRYHTANNVTISGGAGRVLVAGGVYTSGVTATAELFNPSSGTWSYATNMNQKRLVHTGTTLSDGTILVTGGDIGAGVATVSAEIYDPVADTWTVKQSLNTARKQHTATLLNDGRVLVVGGTNSSGTTLSSTEIYTPSTDTWSTGPTLSYARALHTATLLPNGKVLITGGPSTAGTKVEIFDPNSDSLSNGADMNYGHLFHSATLITLSDGTTQQVLVAGSASGGSTNMKHAELYDDINDIWITTNDMNTGRYTHTATLLNDGTLLVTGGLTSGTKSTEYYTAP